MSRPGAFLAAGLLLLAAAGPMARAQEDGLSAEDMQAVRRYLSLQARRVEDLIREGRFEKAERLATALEALGEGAGEDAGAFQILKTRARDALQAARALNGRVEAPEGFHEVGDAIVLRVVLENVSGETLELDLGTGNRAAARVHVAFVEHGYLGDSRTDEWFVPIEGLDGVRTLAPGASWDTTVTLDTADRSPLNATARIYRVRGTVRPRAARVADRALVRPVVLEPAEIRVFPRGLGPMRRNPLETLREGIEDEFGPKVALAARLLPAEQAREGAEILVREHERSFDEPAMRRTLRAALKALTGREDMPLDAAAWRRWWAEKGAAVLSALEAANGDRAGDTGEKD